MSGLGTYIRMHVNSDAHPPCAWLLLAGEAPFPFRLQSGMPFAGPSCIAAATVTIVDSSDMATSGYSGQKASVIMRWANPGSRRRLTGKARYIACPGAHNNNLRIVVVRAAQGLELTNQVFRRSTHLITRPPLMLMLHIIESMVEAYDSLQAGVGQQGNQHAQMTPFDGC